jgi:hypothetical protein
MARLKRCFYENCPRAPQILVNPAVETLWITGSTRINWEQLEKGIINDIRHLAIDRSLWTPALYGNIQLWPFVARSNRRIYHRDAVGKYCRRWPHKLHLTKKSIERVSGANERLRNFPCCSKKYVPSPFGFLHTLIKDVSICLNSGQPKRKLQNTRHKGYGSCHRGQCE